MSDELQEKKATLADAMELYSDTFGDEADSDWRYFIGWLVTRSAQDELGDVDPIIEAVCDRLAAEGMEGAEIGRILEEST